MRCALQPDLVLALMAVLPPGLGILELDTSCCGPVLAAAARFKHLRDLRMHPRQWG